MAKKIELLHTTYDESGNIESQEVVHPLTSPDCIIMENGKTLDEVMGDGIATPTLTHEGTSFKVGVGDSNIEVVDGDVAGMALKGQSYQNILPKPTTLIMETDEKEFKINDKIDSNIIIDDNIAEIATVKGKTIVNAVQEESGSEYTIFGEDLSGQSIVHVKETPTLEGQTLVNLTTNKSSENAHYTDYNLSYIDKTKSYFVKITSTKPIVAIGFIVNNNIWNSKVVCEEITNGYIIIKPNETLEVNGIRIVTSDSTTSYTLKTMVIEYQEGMENWDIPYFTGEKYFESNIKGVTLQGQTLVNTIQEPCQDDYVVLGADDGIEISAETGGHGTIENTVQGGINGAVLEGMTLVNLASNLNARSITITNYYIEEKVMDDLSKLQIGKKYTVLFNTTEVSGNHVNYNGIEVGVGMTSLVYQYTRSNGEATRIINNKNGMSAICFTYTEERYQETVNSNYSALFIRPHRRGTEPIEGESISFTRSGFILVEGDWLNIINELPFNDCFEGMKSVKMPVLTTTGKNLFDKTKLSGGEFTTFNNKNVYKYLDDATNFKYNGEFKKDTQYTLSIRTYRDDTNMNKATTISFYYSDGTISSKNMSHDVPIVVTSEIGKTVEGIYGCFNFAKNVYIDLDNTQIEEGSTATTCEPFKSNILTVNEEVELRGIGDVKDELDLQTGKLTQRVGSSIIDGSNSVVINKAIKQNTTIAFDLGGIPNSNSDSRLVNVITDKFPAYSGEYLYATDIEGMSNSWNTTMLRINRDRLNTQDANGLKQWLAENPIKVTYIYDKEVIKTIDLQVTDQDGNSIPHVQTQPTVTHITASSDYLIPTVTIDNNLSYETIIKPSTLYTVRFKHNTVNADNPLTVDLGGTVQTVTSTEFTITTPSELTHNQLVFSGKNNVVSEVQVIEGNVTNIEYPFFEGMNDVKFSDSKFISTGKNLLDLQNNFIPFSSDGISITYENNFVLGEITEPTTRFFYYKDLSQLPKANYKLIVNFEYGAYIGIELLRPNGTKAYGLQSFSNEEFISLGLYLQTNSNNPNLSMKAQVMLVVDGSDTTYEPYRYVEVQQDVDSIPLTGDMFEQGNIESGKIIGMSYQQLSHNNTETIRVKSKTLIPIKPNGKYIIQNLNKTNNRLWGWQYDENGGYLSSIGNTDAQDVFQFDSKAHYITFVLCNQDNSAITPSDLDSMNLILQEVPQEIVLRSIGDVKDELDLTRGEYIQRIGVMVLDSDRISGYYADEHGVGSPTYQVAYYNHKIGKVGNNSNVLNDRGFVQLNLATINSIKSKYPYDKIIHNYADGQTTFNTIFLSLNKEVFGSSENDSYETTTLKFQQWIDQNPITVQYILATPIIHKVNLTNTKVIPSYATETHYETITPSDSLIPNITIPSTLNYDVAIKPSTEYTIRANTSDNLTVDLGGATGTLSNGKVTLTTPATLTHNEVKFSGTGKVKELMVVEGNEIKDNVPFFNGMKDVQMGGIKLVNIARGATILGTDILSMNAQKTTFTYNGTSSIEWKCVRFDNTLLKPNTTYTMYLNITENTSSLDSPIKFLYNGDGNYVDLRGVGTKKILIKTMEVKGRIEIAFRPCKTSQKIVVQNPMIIEGDWTHLDEIPFIESEMIIEQPIIRSQGKNLFNIRNLKSQGGGTVTVSQNGSNYSVQVRQGSANNNYYWGGIYVDIPMKKGETLQYHGRVSGCVNVRIFKDYNFFEDSKNGMVNYDLTSSTELESFELTRIATEDCVFCCRLWIDTSKGETIQVNNIQIEKSTIVTQYKAYRHQTLYSNRVIGYEEGVHYGGITGIKSFNPSFNSVMADVEGLSIAYVTNGSSNFSFWDKDMVFISGKSYLDTSLSTDNKNGFIQVPSNAKYMKFASANTIGYATDYTKATVTGELPLRSLPNGVCDTLNLVTGEYVQRVGETILCGSKLESYTADVKNATLQRFNVIFIDGIRVADMNMKVRTSLQCNSLPVLTDTKNNQECIHSGGSDDYKLMLWIDSSRLTTVDVDGIRQYLSQNPITVQYELATPIVRKLDFTTKGNYREQVLDGSETWAMDVIDNTKTVRMTKKTTSPLQNALYDTVLFTDDYHVRARDENHATYEYITGIGNSIYINIYQSKVDELSVQGCTQWLSQNPIKVGYISSAQSSESYSNIHKPIFFNNVNVQFLPYNLDIQPQLTLQARTRNSYVMDMMKANTKYSIKLLSSSGNMKIDGTSYALANNRTFIPPSTLTNKELIITGQWYEPMIIEGDVTGKNLPYFNGILSSYHDVDEIEVYSVNKNLFDMSKVKPFEGRGTYWWNTIIKENEVVSVRIGDVNNGQFGAYIKLNVRPNSVYTLYIEMEKDGEPFNGQIYGYENGDLWGNGTFTGYANTPYHINTSHNAKYITIGFNYGKDLPIGTTLVSKNMRLYLGEENPAYIPHAHSTTLIEMPTRLETVKVVRPVMEVGVINTGNGANAEDTTNSYLRSDFIPVHPKEFIYFLNGKSNRVVNIICYNKDKNFMCYLYNSNDYVPENCYFVRIFVGKANTSDLTMTRMAYKPIQLNSLPNGVCDEIIMKPNSNKAQLVQRVGKLVLDGSEDWIEGNWNFNDIIEMEMELSNSVGFNNNMMCESIKVDIFDNLWKQGNQDAKRKESITIFDSNKRLVVALDSNKFGSNNINDKKAYLRQNPITVYYELATPIIHEIQLKGYPHVYENGTVTLNTDTPHQTLVSYNVNQEQLISTQNETIIRHDQQIDDLYYYIEMYLEEIYQMELFRMKLELSL